MSAPSGENVYDVIVIGGGINGTAVARDAALRGLRVALFEKNDFAYGASGNNSGMIHGGPRYLTDHPEVTEQSCRDSGYIQKIAANLLFRIPFLLCVPNDHLSPQAMLAAYDAFFSYYDEFQPLKAGKRHTMLRPEEVRALEPGIVGNIAGAVTFDEWGVDGARISVLNIVDAEAHGAAIFNHTEVVEIIGEKKADGSLSLANGVHARNRLTQQTITAHAKIIVNATGAWSPITSKLAKGASTELRPGKGIHVVYDRRMSNYAIACNAIDGRQIFLMPWGNISWIGTTDDDFYGDLDRIRSTTDEVRYLVQGVAQVFPSVRDGRIIGTTVGVRPTLYRYGPLEDQLSREHEIVDHAKEHQISGLYSMVGGKLASYRIFAEEMTDVLVKDLGRTERGTSHLVTLPGNDAIADAAAIAEKFKVPEPTARRLVYRHGTRSEKILERAESSPRDREVVCACEPVLACEVRHAIREEHACTLNDLSRRTRLGLGACGGMNCAHRAAQILGEERGDQNAHRNAPLLAAKFLTARYRNRVVALDGAQLAQEELLAASLAYGGHSPAQISEESEP